MKPWERVEFQKIIQDLKQKYPDPEDAVLLLSAILKNNRLLGLLGTEENIIFPGMKGEVFDIDTKEIEKK